MKIGIDLDDVTAEFFEALLAYHNKKYGRNDKSEDLKEWSWWPLWQIDKEEAIKRADLFHEIHKVEEIPPVKDAVDSINKLSKNNELFIITSRPSRFKSKVEAWILHHIGRPIKVIHSGDFHEGQAVKKYEICKELGIKIMIEDGAKIAIDCANSGIKTLLFNRPWNQGAEHKNIIRVNSWKEILEVIGRLETK